VEPYILISETIVRKGGQHSGEDIEHIIDINFFSYREKHQQVVKRHDNQDSIIHPEEKIFIGIIESKIPDGFDPVVETAVVLRINPHIIGINLGSIERKIKNKILIYILPVIKIKIVPIPFLQEFIFTCRNIQSHIIRMRRIGFKNIIYTEGSIFLYPEFDPVNGGNIFVVRISFIIQHKFFLNFGTDNILYGILSFLVFKYAVIIILKNKFIDGVFEDNDSLRIRMKRY
jgi:hypothetical protein